MRPPNFTKEQLEVLMDWLENNLEHPYPTKTAIKNLKLCTGLDTKQINLWCTNIRRVIDNSLISIEKSHCVEVEKRM